MSDTTYEYSVRLRDPVQKNPAFSETPMARFSGTVACAILGTILLATSTQPAWAQIIEVTETQKTPYKATLMGFTKEGLSISQPTERVIPLESLLRVRFLPPRAIPRADLAVEVELRGGSRVFASEVSSDGKQIELQCPFGALQFPTKAVSTIRFRRLNAILEQQWKTLVDSKIASDILIIARSEEALDKIEGIAGKVTSEAVSFEIDGQSIDAPRGKLAGLKFFSNQPVSGPLTGAVRDLHRNEWIISQIKSEAGSCTLKLNSGENVKLAIADLAEIDLSYGNMRYVAELEPLERTSTPRFELGVELDYTKKLFGARRLEPPNSSSLLGPSVEFVGAGTAVYRAPVGFTKLVGTAKLNPSGHSFVECRAAVMLEDKVLWEHTFDTTRKEQPISVAIESDKRIRLVVEAKSERPVGDIVVFDQLRFMK